MQTLDSPKTPRKRSFSFHEQSSCRRSEDDPTARTKKYHDKGLVEEGPEALPPPCTCPYFGESSKKPPPPSSEIVIVSSETMRPIGNKGLEIGLSGDIVRPIGGKNPEAAGLLGRNNSGQSTDGAGKGHEQLTLANSVVTWRGGRRGSSLGT